MFPSPATGEMYHPDSVKILKDASLEHIPLYSLRHTFATVALQNGIDVKQYAGPLRRRLYLPYLHPCHPASSKSGSRNHGKFHGPGHVTQNRLQSACQKREEVPIQTSPLRRVFSYCGSRCGSAKARKDKPAKNVPRTTKNPPKSTDFRGFLELLTSSLPTAWKTRNRWYSAVSGPFCSRKMMLSVLSAPLSPSASFPVWVRLWVSGLTNANFVLP